LGFRESSLLAPLIAAHAAEEAKAANRDANDHGGNENTKEGVDHGLDGHVNLMLNGVVLSAYGCDLHSLAILLPFKFLSDQSLVSSLLSLFSALFGAAFDKILNLVETVFLAAHGLHHLVKLLVLHIVLLLEELAALLLHLLHLFHLGH